MQSKQERRLPVKRQSSSNKDYMDDKRRVILWQSSYSLDPERL